MTDLLLAEPRTLNVNQAELYNFFTNDSNASGNIIAIGGQVRILTRRVLANDKLVLLLIPYFKR